MSNLLGRGRQASEVVIKATGESSRVGCCRRRQLVSFESSKDKMVQIVLRPTGLFDAWHFGSFDRLERPQVEALAGEQLHDWIARIGPGVADVFVFCNDTGSDRRRGGWPRSAIVYPAF